MGSHRIRRSRPAAGSIIFYIPSTGPPKASAVRQTQRPTSGNASSSGSNTSSASTWHSRGTLATTFTSVTTSTSDSSLLLTSTSSTNATNLSVLRLDNQRSAIETVLGIVRIVSESLENVPYIKIVAGLVQQIITISEELQANKERYQELVDKVLTYAKVVFDALLLIQQRQQLDGLQDLEDDIVGFSNVLKSTYGLLQNMAASSRKSLLDRMLSREDVAGRIAELDRRLNVAVNAFQMKSIMVLRTGKAVENEAIAKPSLLQNLSKVPTTSYVLRPKPIHIYGRTNELNSLVREVTQKEQAPRICILGSGGIGKTALALSLLHDSAVIDFFRSRRYFVAAETASSPDLLLAEIARALNVAGDASDEPLLQRISRHINEFQKKILVLDNFETSWDPLETRREVESILEFLNSSSSLTLIVTMRGSQYPAGCEWTRLLPPLQPISLAAAIETFETIANKADRYAIELLKAVDCVPLAVMLISYMAAVDGETTEALLSRWKDENISMLGDGHDRLSSVEQSVKLSLQSPRMQRELGAFIFLRAIALLPDGITAETIQACERGFPEVVIVKRAIFVLRQNALIYDDTSQTIRILSPIRHYILVRHFPSSGSQRFLQQIFLDLALQGTSYHEPSVRLRLCKEFLNIDAMLLQLLGSANADDLLDVVKSVIHFCHYTYTSGRATAQAISLAVEKLESIRVQHIEPQSIPAAPKKLLSLRPVFLRKKKVLDVVVSDVQPNVASNLTVKLLADCLGCWGQILCRQGQFDMAKAKFNMAKDLHLKSGDKIAHAYDVLNIGMALSHSDKDSENALEALGEAVSLHATLGNQAGAAQGLMGAAHIHSAHFRYEDAISKFSEALSVFETLNDQSGRAASLNGLGLVMQSLSRFSEAAVYFSDAANICASSGDIIGEADNIASLAGAHLLSSRFADAYEMIQKAIELRKHVVDADHLHILARVLIAQARYAEARTVLERSLTLHTDSNDRCGMTDDFLYLSILCVFTEGWGRSQYSYLYSARIHSSNSPSNILTRAHIDVRYALAKMNSCEFEDALAELESIRTVFEEKRSFLDLADCLCRLGVLHLRMGEYESSERNLTRALEIHTEVGNIQGQADDMNRICELWLAQWTNHPSEFDFQEISHKVFKLVNRALALHIRIEDKSGQGDSLFILSLLFSERGMLEDAETALRQALELHTSGSSMYGQAKDLAGLCHVLHSRKILVLPEVEREGVVEGYRRKAVQVDASWSAASSDLQHGESEDWDLNDPFECINNAVRLFHRLEYMAESQPEVPQLPVLEG